MVEKRKHKRIPLHYYLKLSDSKTREHLGFMIDISMEGFKLLSEEQIQQGSVIAFTLTLPDKLVGKKELSFNAKACWSGRDVNPEYFVSGYHIDAIEPDGDLIIAQIINQYGYNV